jgi:hypothetical protein
VGLLPLFSYAKLKSIIECHCKSCENDTGFRKHRDEPNDLKHVGLLVTKRKKRVVNSDQRFPSLKSNHGSSNP